ncbi:MAG TPA: ATP-grasp domain-containing protein [Streptosporangiaceae bacterium]
MTASESLPVAAVVYSTGSAGPAMIARAALGLCEVLFVCDTANPGVGQLIAGMRRRFRVCDISGLDARAAAAALRDEKPAGVTTFSEHCLTQTAQLAAALRLRYPESGVIQTIVDKFAQRSALRAAGIDDTPSTMVRSAAEVHAAAGRIGYPVVVKPRTGSASRCTVRIDGPGQCLNVLAGNQGLAADLAGPPAFVVEKCLLGDDSVAGKGWGDYVSVEAAMLDGVHYSIAVAGKLPLAVPFRETGHFIPSTLSAAMESEVTEFASAAVRTLGITDGITHTEVKLTGNGPRVIEVNARMGGHVVDVLMAARGYDLTRAALQVALGRRPDPVASRRAGVGFKCFLVAPQHVGRVRSVCGADETREIPGIAAVDVLAAPGQDLDWRMGNQRLGSVEGTAPDHLSLRSVITEIGAKFYAEYEEPYPLPTGVPPGADYQC